jgi:tetratricopeptide (TPR) repeat protein
LTASVDSALSQALSALQAGNAESAEQAFKNVLRLQPRHVAALNLYSILLTKTERFAEAEQYIQRALNENATSDASFYNYGVILKALKRPEDALQQFSRALALNSTVAETWNSRGDIYIALEKNQEAIADFDKALAIDPKFVEAFVNKARAMARLKQYEPALEVVDRALALLPHHELAWLCRGNILIDLRRPEDAMDAFERALALKPDLAEAWVGQGLVNIRLDRLADALDSYDKALNLKPGSVEAWTGRGNVFLKMKRNEDAFASLGRALELQPEHAPAWHDRGIVLTEFGRYDEALASYEKALTIKPDMAAAYNSKGHLLMVLGRMKEASDAFRKSVELEPEVGFLYYNLAELKKFKSDDPDLATMVALAAKKTTLSKKDRMLLDFALGKAFSDIRDYRRAFQHLLAGNAAERSAIKYDEADSISLFDNIENIFTNQLIAAKSGFGEPSRRPIFVIGMPRSGSTLLEQVLASHPAVEGIGEVGALADAMNNVTDKVLGPDGNPLPYPANVPMLNDSTIKSIGENYIGQLAALAQHGQRVTDKMLANYLYAGLIHLVLPNAVILHTVRDPVDTCISCFSKWFSTAQPYTYELAELGRYYTRYRQLMEHWRRVLPPGRILDVQYEEVVADLEGQARRIISHCGLPWDDRCLSFHKTDRPVWTGSVSQVRQPIYNHSVGRWRVYEEFLTPLLKELGIKAPAGE